MVFAAADTPFHLDPTFWVAVCVVLFFAFILWKGAFKSMGSALDKRADGIKAELEEARRLREEAQTLLASYQRKLKEAEGQAEAIVTQARNDAENMAADARRDLADRLERRAKQAEDKIATAEAQALNDVRNKAAEVAAMAAEKLIRNDLTASDHARIIKSGIDQISSTLN